jgi:hypothetical protein
MPSALAHRAGGIATGSTAIVTGMSKSEKRHPVRKFFLLALIAGAVVAVRNAVADKGGSYDPNEADPR